MLNKKNHINTYMEIISKFYDDVYEPFLDLTLSTKILILTIVMIIFLYLYNRKSVEAFESKQQVIIKTQDSMMDSFYVKAYDELVFKQLHDPYLIGNIINQIDPTSESIILQLGSKNGSTINHLQKKNIKAIGSDENIEFINNASKRYPESEFVHSNPLNKMAFRDNQFTHILCLDNMIYSLNQKKQVIQNIYEWIMPGGYFVCNLMEPKSFENIVNTYNQSLLSIFKKGFTQIGEYKYSFSLKHITDDIYELEEVFQKSNSIRKQIQTFTIPPLYSLINMMKETGFIVIGQSKLMYDNLIYIFQKPE